MIIKCCRCGAEVDNTKYIGHLCQNPQKTINADLKAILDEAITKLVECASEAQSCKIADNPTWLKVVDALDECTDELRSVEAKL